MTPIIDTLVLALWAALFACTIILFNGYRIFRAALNEIMDAAPPETLHQKLFHRLSPLFGKTLIALSVAAVVCVSPP